MHCRPVRMVYYNSGSGYTVASYITEEELPREASLQDKSGHGRG